VSCLSSLTTRVSDEQKFALQTAMQVMLREPTASPCSLPPSSPHHITSHHIASKESGVPTPNAKKCGAPRHAQPHAGMRMREDVTRQEAEVKPEQPRLGVPCFGTSLIDCWGKVIFVLGCRCRCIYKSLPSLSVPFKPFP